MPTDRKDETDDAAEAAPAKTAREARLAQALRTNLRRRKISGRSEQTSTAKTLPSE